MENTGTEFYSHLPGDSKIKPCLPAKPKYTIDIQSGSSRRSTSSPETPAKLNTQATESGGYLGEPWEDGMDHIYYVSLSTGDRKLGVGEKSLQSPQIIKCYKNLIVLRHILCILNASFDRIIHNQQELHLKKEAG